MMATLALLGWFVVMTRAEPSVVRAATMAGVAAVGFAVGGRHRTGDVLLLSVTFLVVVDPFLVWSVGWWMSVGGTVGLVYVAPLLTAAWVRRSGNEPGTVVEALLTTVAAQWGVLPVTVLMFGWPNALSIAANLLAVPVAGVVMLVGIPASIASGIVPGIVASLVMRPVGVLVWWVDVVARFGERFRPPPFVDVVVTATWAFTVLTVVVRSLLSSHSGVPILGNGRVPLPRSRRGSRDRGRGIQSARAGRRR